jgi:ribosomal protein S18 acetylase RimI-like enzyme
MNYKINTATQLQICDLLYECNNNFIPSLSSRVSIEDYSKKIFSNAVNFEAWNNKKLIGLISMYINNNFGYITNVCVLKTYSKKGVASKLLQNCFNYAIENKTFYIELETNENNIAAMKLYTKFGFKFSKKDKI